MTGLWAWCFIASLLVTSDAQQLDGPIIMSPSEILLQKGENYSINCKGRRPLEFKIQEAGEEDDGNFEKILRNVAPSDNNYKYEISLELRNVDRFAVGYYACHDDLIDAEELFKGLTEEPSNTEHISYTYVYVNDTENLIAPMKEIVYVTKHASKTVIECKPTFPDIQVNLSMEFIVSEYNPKLGYILDSTNSLDLEPMTELICEFERNGLRDETNVYLDISTSINMETPKIFPKQPFFLQNETIFLNCTMKYTANTAIILNWKIPRDSSQVEFESNENQIQNDLYKAIRVRNAKKTDAGKYICEAIKGEIEKTNDSVNMKFLDEPFLKLSTASDKEITTIFKASEFTFLFILDGYPFPTYQYFKDGNKSITNGTKYSFKTTFSPKYPKLLINNLDIFDTGNYTIEAKNAYRTERETVHLYVRDIPRITLNLSGGRKLKGQQVKIVCEVTGFPLPDVAWTFIDDQTNKPINEPGKLEKVSDYKVVSTLDLLVQTSGTIICKASNAAEGDVKKTYESKIGLLVEEIDGGFGIENGEKKFKDVSEKDSITLRCLASTYDFMSVDWIPPNGVELPDNSVEQSNNAMSRIATLQIHDVSLSQSGEYTCVGYNNITNVQRRATIFIRVAGIHAPTIKFPALDTTQEVIPYQHLTLTCIAEAIPPPEITWLKDGKILDKVESSNVKAISLNYGTVNSTYTFQQNGTDNLIYECVARSGSHEVSKQYHISIKMPKMPLKTEYIAIIGAIIVALILLVLYLWWKIKKEKQFRKELAAAGLLYFKEGAPRSLNPELGIDEQAELLPYDEKFEFPPEKLILGPQLGAGAFGVVYKAEARGIINAEDVTTVAVKMVKKTADNIYIKALASELKIMVHLGKHVNIVNLLGACTKNVGKRELVVIVEFCKFGNIHNYMQRHRDVFIDQLTDNKEKSQGNVNRGFSCSGVDSGMTSDCLNTNQTQQTDHTFLNTAASNRSGRLDKPNPNSESVKVSETGYVQPEWRSNYVSDYVYEGRKPRPLTSRDLLAWAFQIARGMEYLASMKILHGDLAARNILLAEDNVVKICDFGLARSIYKNDEYQKKENSPLPVKWLAVECMTDRIFSTQSDVWSFGIVLWELFSLAKTPYPEISPQDLLQRLQEGHRLSKPPYADDRLYRVMRACWEQRPPKRPTFTELQETIGSFLEDSVRNHYVDLNQPCAETNAVRAGENYLVQVCAPDYNHQVTPSPHHYANDANGFFFGVTPKPPAIHLQHDDEGYLAMTPASQNVFSPRMGSAFDFDARVLNGRGSAASQNSELTPMLTLNHLSTRSGSESDHDGNTSPYLNMHPRIDEETEEVFETETKMNNLKNSQNNAVTNPTYITFPSIDKKSPIVSNNYVNVNGNGLVK